MVDPVTPVPGLTSVVTTGGTPVQVSTGGDSGGFIVNPASAADQGLVTAESLFINPVGSADVHAFGETFELFPGQSWEFIAGQTTPTSVNAATGGHRFSVVRY